MKSLKIIFSTILILVYLSSIQSFADTFVVTNLNDPGAGSLRLAIANSNGMPGPDEIVFEEGLEGTIVLNLGQIFIQDDLTITGPGTDRITIDADGKSPIFDVNDFDNAINRVVEISGLRLINADGFDFGLVGNFEILTVDSCQFINGNGLFGGAIHNSNILTVDSCLFENNSADFGGGAINHNGFNLIVRNSEFVNNQTSIGGGGAIFNESTIELIANSTFRGNRVSGFESGGGAILNARGTIKEISHSTFALNNNLTQGGAIWNQEGLIQTIVNSTFTGNYALRGSVIWNDGLINISFTTIADNPPIPPQIEPPPPSGPIGGIVTVGSGVTRVRNSIFDSNSLKNCSGDVNDFGGNYSDDFSCDFFGDGSEIILGPLADNGGPTETMALIGGDPLDAATVNCDALDENGNPTGIPIGKDQRYFPRPAGVRCDSGAFETGPESIVTITKVTDPSGGSDFRFGSNGFNPLQQCPLDGGGDGIFALNDGDSISCRVPEGEYSINELVPDGYELFIACFGDNENLIIDNDRGEIVFTVPEIEPSPDVDCLFTNVRTVDGGDGGGCTLAPTGAKTSIPLYLLIPALILVRRFVKRYRS